MKLKVLSISLELLCLILFNVFKVFNENYSKVNENYVNKLMKLSYKMSVIKCLYGANFCIFKINES